tara:strand:- start:7834 stop:8082 length:249 start_codon:yes stop_codon:yes gene_type:complete
MTQDLTHALNILTTLRKANLSTSTIEKVIEGLPMGTQEKRNMSIINTGCRPPHKSDYFQKTDLIDLYLTNPHEVQLDRINYN